MVDNKEQRVCAKFCFLLGKSAEEAVLMLQEAIYKILILYDSLQWCRNMETHRKIIRDGWKLQRWMP